MRVAAHLLLLIILALGPSTAHAQPARQREHIDSLITLLHRRGQFNGSILIAVGGRVLYRNAFGEADLASHRPFTPSTLSCIGSLSKQFTAMAVMMLAEQGTLKYDDPAVTFLPELRGVAGGVTIRHLLTHTSGIPDVGDLGIDSPGLTNDVALRRLATLDAKLPAPGLRFQYSNTGYLLLATIVERVSGRRFTDFLRERILRPLEMNDTFLAIGDAPRPANLAVGYGPFGGASDCYGQTSGMGDMYSTVDDLAKWEAALSTARLVRRTTLDTAFTPYPVKEGTSTYGFGWNISSKDDTTFIWHTGNTGSYKAFLGRTLPERIAVIILTNKGNSKRMQINEAVVNIIRERPFTTPPGSLAEHLYAVIQKEGIPKALETYKELRRTNSPAYDFAESELNALGYQLVSEGKLAGAIQVFELNATAYPRSSNAFDSLGEAHMKAGNRALAIKYYDKAVELDPNNLNAVTMLKRLK